MGKSCSGTGEKPPEEANVPMTARSGAALGNLCRYGRLPLHDKEAAVRIVFLAIGFSAGLAATPFAAPLAGRAEAQLQDFLAPMRVTPVRVDACTPMAVNIYFSRDDVGLSSAAQSTLDIVSERMRGCAIAAVAIESASDSVSTAQGRRVAGLRGAALLKGLSTRGVTPGSIVIAETASEEPASAAPTTPDHVRVSITPDAAAEEAARPRPKVDYEI
jgi:hypothetical protein